MIRDPQEFVTAGTDHTYGFSEDADAEEDYQQIARWVLYAAV